MNNKEFVSNTYSQVLAITRKLNLKHDVSFSLTPPNFKKMIGQITMSLDFKDKSDLFLSEDDFKNFLACKINLFFNIQDLNYTKDLVNKISFLFNKAVSIEEILKVNGFVYLKPIYSPEEQK